MLQNIVDGELRRIDETFLRNPGLIPQQVFGVHDRISEHGMFVIRRVYCHHRQGGMITPSGGSGFTSKMLAMSISGSPLRSEDQSFGSWVPTFKPSLKSDQSVIEILGMPILEDDSPFFMIHSTDHESLSRFNSDLDPPHALDPAGHSRERLVEFRQNREDRNFPTSPGRPHSSDISLSGLIPEGKLLLSYDLDLELLEMGDQLLPLRVVPQDDPGGSSFTHDPGMLHRLGQQNGQVVDARRCFACQEGEVEIL